MNYKEALEYITSLNKYGSVLGLDNMIRLCEKLDHPEDKCKCIHIAGTNGKGSTSAYIAHMLMAAGYRVGRYSSPTISDYRERFQIGKRMITQKDLCEYVERLKAVCEELVAEGHPHPTPFEVETALGFLYFAEKNCDYVVKPYLIPVALEASATTNEPPTCSAFFCKTTSTSRSCLQLIRSEPSFAIPAFTPAILVRSFPKKPI